METEQLNPKEYKEDLLAGFSIQENLFEDAVKSLGSSIKKNIDDLETEFNKVASTMPSEENFDANGNRMPRFRILTRLHNLQSSQKQQWLAINEMRVLYLFKSLEISLKSLIATAYPSTNIRDLYKWDSIIYFFIQKDIDIKKVDGYKEANELRRLNNNLKHSQDLDADVMGILEFKNAEFIDSQMIESFLDRIDEKLKSFQRSLIKEVRRDLYDFDEERLNSIAKEYFKRLDKDQANILVTKIRQLYK